ncbi:MAG: Sec-independent protein translocase protein TatB [Pseudomonadota bacterium]
MFDIGWSELLVLGAIALIVVGPKDLPGMLRKLGQFAGQAKRLARDFQRSMEEAADQADLKEMRDLQKSVTDWKGKVTDNTLRKRAESFLDGEGEDAAKAPDPGSHAAAEEAESAAWEARQAAKPASDGPAAGDAPEPPASDAPEAGTPPASKSA